MIEPKAGDAGRRVIYARQDPHRRTEYGVLKGWNQFTCFVRYDTQRGDADGQATARSDLEWETE